MEQQAEDLELLQKVLEIYDQKQIANYLNELGQDNWNRETINRWLKGKSQPKLSHAEFEHLKSLLPSPPVSDEHDFTFIDLFHAIPQSYPNTSQITDHLAQTGRGQGKGMICTFPGSIEGEVPLDDSCSEHIGTHHHGDAVIVR